MTSDRNPYRAAFLDPADGGVRAAWGSLVALSEQRTPFAALAFGEAAAEAFGLRLRIVGVWEEPSGHVLQAGLLSFEKRRGPYRALALAPLVPVLSPLLAGPLDEADVHARQTPLDALLGLLGRTYQQATLALHPSLGDARPFQWAGWRCAPAYTYRLDFPEGSSVTAGWSSGPRRLLRKADVEVDEGAHLIREVVALVEASHRRQGQPLGAEAGEVERLAAALVPAHGQAYVARQDGAEAGLVLLRDDRCAYYWLAGSRPGPAMTALVAEALRRERARGVAALDFVGANVPSIAEFKRRLGGRLVVAYRARLTTRPELRALDALRGL